MHVDQDRSRHALLRQALVQALTRHLAAANSAMKREVATGEAKRLRVLMISDFFYPNVGGVENHIFQLSQCLLARGHHVVVATHAYGERTGVRYLTNGLKVYHIPRLPFYANATFPTFLGLLRLLRSILIRERITLVRSQLFCRSGSPKTCARCI